MDSNEIVPNDGLIDVLKLIQSLFNYEKAFIEEAYPTIDYEKTREKIIDDLKKSLAYELPNGLMWMPT